MAICQNGAYEDFLEKERVQRIRYSYYAYGALLICGLLFFIINNYTSSIDQAKSTSQEVTLSTMSRRKVQQKVASLSTVKTVSETIPRSINSCVPFYNLIQKHVMSGTGKRNWPKTSLSLVSAYAYPDYSVVTIEADGYFGQKVYCRYFDKNWVELEASVESVVFPNFIIHCCRYQSAAYMGITESKDAEINFTVPVLDRTIDNPKYILSLCLAPIYGNESKWLLLAELIEHYKLQGVEHFYIYIKDIDNYSRKLLDDYVKSGEVELVFFKEGQDRPGKEWQLVGVEDCVQRSRHHSRYSIFADLDERILALGNFTLAEYVQRTMIKKPNIGMIQFRTMWILRTHKLPISYQGERTLRNHLPTFVFHNTSAIAPVGHTAKCVLDTRRVLLMWVHYVSIYFPGYDGTVAAPEEAIIRHYRDVAADNWGTTWIREVETFGSFRNTNYPEDLMQRLHRNVEKRLSQVYLRS
ncbi:hypothetical protein RB195_018130 [Necator americanus]|uniref:Glycosyltransferase family 92 protein n=1 Tax=Necator americanus TaxID=51031 RepID=A0ABR1C8A7_NECAM